MVASPHRLPVKRAHQLKRQDAKRDDYIAAKRAVTSAATPAASSPAPAASSAPPAAAPAAPAAPAPASTTSAAPSVTPLVSAPLPVVKPVSAQSSDKTGSTSFGGAPSPVSSASRLVVKTLSSTAKSSAFPSASPSVGHSTGSLSNNSSGLSGGGIAGILIGIIIFLVGVFLFVRRKRAMMARKAKRNWERDLFPNQDEISEKPVPALPSGQYAFQAQAGFAPLTPLSASYNNPAPPVPAMAPGRQLFSTFKSADMSGKPTAIIRCTFIPSLPDELSITTGELVTVVNEYDDGWALCANVRGEQGMVPLECLAKDTAAPSAPELDWKNAQRASSLVSRDGVRY